MPFKPGDPKPPGSGRAKGTQNKRIRVEAYLAEKGIEPVKEIIELLQTGRMFDSDKMSGWFRILSYCEPKPGPIREDEGSLTLIDRSRTFEEFVEVAGYPKPFPAQMEMVEWTFEDDLKEPRLLLGSRGYGKTDYVSLLGVAYEIYKDPMHFSALLVTKSPERNAAILGEVAAALEKNGVQLSIENAKELRVPELLGKDNSYSAVTIGASSFRGRHPKLVIMDDPVTPEDTRDAARKRVRVVYDELYKLCKNIVIIGQPVHKFDLYGDLRPILRKKEFPYGCIPELDPDLAAMRIAGITEDTIQASYFLNVANDLKNPFDNIKDLEVFPDGDTIAFLDPSFKGIDFTAMSIGRGYFDGIAIQGKAWKRGWDNCLEEIAQACKTYRVRKLIYETNTLGDMPVQLLRDALSALGVTGIEIHGHESNGKKHSRILAAGNFSHLIHLARSSDKVYSDQVKRYEYDAEHDDAPDSLASLLAWLGLIKGKETGR